MLTAHWRFLIIVVLVILLALLGFVFYKFNLEEKLGDVYFKITEKSQTVGSVTVSRDVNKIKITEIEKPFWDTKTISPVVGKAYKIDQLKTDGRPVHVEFAYNPKDVPISVLPADLRLFKWHDENGKKYWAMIPSKVDEVRKVVTADVTSFSVLAIKAPVRAYLTSAEISSINQKLADMMETPPRFACGVSIIMQEELVTDEFDYQRTDDEDIMEYHGCRENGSVEPRNAFFYFSRQKEGKSFTYVADALVVWQIDPEESITVEGFVVDESGKAVEGAAVIAKKTEYDNWEQKTTTDKSGHYKMKIHSGEYNIRAIPKDSKCAGASISGQLCYKGDLSEEPFTQNYWRKDLTVKKCSKYELTITSKIITTALTALGPVTDTNEVRGSAVITTGAGAVTDGNGSITIDKFTYGGAQGVECKQIKPVLYKFKIKGDSLATVLGKELFLVLDFSENDEDVPEEAYETNLLYDPTNTSDEANARKHAEEAKKYNNYECDYVSSWAGHLGIAIISDRWLGDFIDIHSDEGLNGSAIRSASIFEIKDWDIINDKGVWARKTYQRKKDLYGGHVSAEEDTIFELKEVN